MVSLKLTKNTFWVMVIKMFNLPIDSLSKESSTMKTHFIASIVSCVFAVTRLTPKKVAMRRAKSLVSQGILQNIFLTQTMKAILFDFMVKTIKRDLELH